jgi:molybdopterin synthase catalytic subunit
MWVEILFFDKPLPPPPPAPEQVRGLAGAWAEFQGCVRATENGHNISALRYEIYESMALVRISAHLDALAHKHGLLAARFWHRHGVVPIGEAAVYAAVAAPHRGPALKALGELIDLLKSDVPIWKVEALPA